MTKPGRAALALLDMMFAHGGDRTPTEWARLCFPDSRRHSAYTSPLLWQLFNAGLVVRSVGMNGRTSYRFFREPGL